LAENCEQAGNKVWFGVSVRFHLRAIMPLVAEKFKGKEKAADTSFAAWYLYNLGGALAFRHCPRANEIVVHCPHPKSLIAIAPVSAE
jgi:hypothetical protein